MDDIRRAAEILLDHLVKVDGQHVELDVDMFWDVPPPALYDVYNRPDELTVGQVTEALEHLRDIANGETEPLSYGLVWLAAVLRAISHKVVR